MFISDIVNIIDNTIKQSNNIYSWRKNDIREDWKFRKALFYNMKTTNISEIEKNMVVLDSGATNGVCPFEELCFNIRKETNNMDCGGGNNMSSKLVGDMLIKGRGKDM